MRARGALLLALICVPAHGNWICKIVGRATGWATTPPAQGAPPEPATRVNAYLKQILPAPATPGQEIKIIDLGAANYEGKETGVSDATIAALIAMGYKPTIYVNDLHPEPTEKAARAVKKRWGDKVTVRGLDGDYTSKEFLAKVKALGPQLVFMMNPGREVIDHLGGNKPVATVMANMAAASEHGLYFRSAFNEDAPVPAFRTYFPTSFMRETFGDRAHHFGDGDNYSLHSALGASQYGNPRDYLIRPPPK